MKYLKGTRLYSSLTGTCPVCQKTYMYEEHNAYKLSKTLLLKERCDHCFLKFNMEPSFFFGAMYVSYSLGVALAVATFIIVFFFLGIKDKLYILLSITGVLIVLMPIIQRLSRNIWLNIFIGYDRRKANNTREENLMENPPMMTKK